MTTIPSVQSPAGVAIGGDGRVTPGGTVVKHDALKVRRLHEGKVLSGFAARLCINTNDRLRVEER